MLTPIRTHYHLFMRTRNLMVRPYNLLKDLVNLGAEFPLRGAGLAGDDNDGSG